MSKDDQSRILLAGAVLSATVLAICVMMLIVEYVEASKTIEPDEQHVLALQKKIAADATLADDLEVEHERQTVTQQQRRDRQEGAAWTLIAAAIVFITCAKWRTTLEGYKTVTLEKLVELTVSAHAGSGKRGSRRGATADSTGETETLDLHFVDELIAQFGRSPEAAISILQGIQAHYRYLPDEALDRVCQLTEITPAQIAGTSSFYAHFRRSPVGDHVVRVCHGTACHVAGARQITEEIRRHLSIPEGEDTDPQRMFTVDEVACLGCCSLAPVLMVDDHTAGRLTPTSACESLYASVELPE